MSDRTGVLLVLEHVHGVAVVAALLTLCLGLGRVVLRRLSVEETPLDECLLGVALGGGLVSLSMLALGSIGALRPLPITLAVAALAWAARTGLVTLPRLVRGAARQVGGDGEYPVLGAIALGATILATVFLVSLALTPTVDWDSLLLHLRVPSQLLAESRLYVPEDNLPSGFLALVHMLYVPLLAAGAETGPALLSAAYALLLALTVVAVCQRFYDQAVAWLAVIGLWGTSMILMVAVTPRVDVSLAFHTLLGHYALLRFIDPPPASADEDVRAGGVPWVGAALLGLMASVKYHGLAYAALLAPLVLVGAARTTRGPGATAKIVIVAASAALLILSPWVIKNLVLF
ncbi:MAG: hypothetical protein MJB57_11615, partial [Gemmatimonadetes bacterium]|nr:hypothetical protein [Gemmatimonadota bacterium]